MQTNEDLASLGLVRGMGTTAGVGVGCVCGVCVCVCVGGWVGGVGVGGGVKFGDG